jgi:hypothetical protein
MQKRQETFDETVKIPGSALTRSSGRYNESEPVSMFGKFISAPLGKKPLPSINRHFDDDTMANGGAPSKLHENKQATVSHLQPQLDLNFSGERQVKSYQSFVQSSASMSRSMSKVYNPLLSSGRWRKTTGRYSGASGKNSQSYSHLSDVTRKYENIIGRKGRDYF